MLEGLLFYDEEKDEWLLKHGEKNLLVSNLIYGICDLESFFPNFDDDFDDKKGQKVRFTFEIFS